MTQASRRQFIATAGATAAAVAAIGVPSFAAVSGPAAVTQSRDGLTFNVELNGQPAGEIPAAFLAQAFPELKRNFGAQHPAVAQKVQTEFNKVFSKTNVAKLDETDIWRHKQEVWFNLGIYGETKAAPAAVHS